MHLHGFSLEVLVDGQPLPEYNLPINESNLKSTSLSYVIDSFTNVKNYSDVTTYVPVITSEERYSIRFEANKTDPSDIIISRVYIDGQSDQVQHLHQGSCSRTRSFFCNYERTKVYFFKFSDISYFDKNEDTTSNNFKVPFPINNKPSIKQQQNMYGKPGSVTVCFFKGIIVDQNALQNKEEFEVKQVEIPESTDNEDIEIDHTTGFDVMNAKIQPATVTKIISLNPIAVLHLCYRSVDWFDNKGLFLSTPDLEKEKDDINSNDNKDEKKDNAIIKEQIENNINNAEQKLEEDKIISELQQNNLKRNYDEINVDILSQKECNNNMLKKLCVE